MTGHVIKSKGSLVERNDKFISGGHLLLAHIKKEPIVGKGISSNKIVGIVSPAPSQGGAILKTNHHMTALGGELLNKINFGTSKSNKRDNIKFIF